MYTKYSQIFWKIIWEAPHLLHALLRTIMGGQDTKDTRTLSFQEVNHRPLLPFAFWTQGSAKYYFAPPVAPAHNASTYHSSYVSPQLQCEVTLHANVQMRRDRFWRKSHGPKNSFEHVTENNLAFPFHLSWSVWKTYRNICGGG